MPTVKIRDIAARLNISEKTVYKWLNQGLIPATRIGKTWVVTEEGLEQALNPTSRGATPPSSPGRPESRSARGATSSSAELATLHRLTSIAEGAIEEGILAILRPRRLADDASRAIGTALESATGDVLLMGIGLREFFGDQGHSLLLQRMIDEDRPVNLRAVLVNPMGSFARARTVTEYGRSFAESTRFRTGPLFGDSWRSLNVISSMRAAARSTRNFKFEVRFADYWPSVYLVLTGESCFVEPYHFGRPPGSLTGSTIEGLVPMLQVAAGSRYYDTMRAHFDQIWGGNNPHITVDDLDGMMEKLRAG